MKTTATAGDTDVLDRRAKGAAVGLTAMTALAQSCLRRPGAAFIDRTAPYDRLTVVKNQLELLAAMNSAAALIDSSGVCVLNQPGLALLSDDIMVRQNRLTAADNFSNKRLQALIARVLDPEQPAAGLAPVVVLRQDRRPLVVSALPLTGHSAAGRRDYAILLLTDPETRSVPNRIVLQEGFGLTHAEARLAQLLAGGESLESAAESLGITKGTASQRLKSIFAKTETHRQGELVSLLSGLVPSAIACD